MPATTKTDPRSKNTAEPLSANTLIALGFEFHCAEELHNNQIVSVPKISIEKRWICISVVAVLCYYRDYIKAGISRVFDADPVLGALSSIQQDSHEM